MIQSYLDALEAAGLISLAQAEPEREYFFRHVLIQEAVYASMLREDRRTLHRAIGLALERLYSEQETEFAATLAHHFAEAGETQRALHYFTMAGDIAYSRYALPEAISHYAKGIGCAWQMADSQIEERLCYLYIQRGRALELNARYDEALQNYAEAIGRGQERGFAALQLAALVEQAKVRLTPNPAYDAEQGKASAEQALALAERLGNQAAQARIYWIRMLGCWLDSKPVEAKAFGEQSLALARQLGLREQLAYTLHDLHRSYHNLGESLKAAAVLEESRHMWREMDNLPMLADNLASSADLYLALGDYDRALELAEEAFHISHSIGNLWNQAFARQVTGEVYSNLGRFDLASAAIQEAIALSKQAGLVILNARARLEMAHLAMQVGALDQSRRILDALRAQFGNLEAFFEHRFVTTMLAVSALTSIRQGELERAEHNIQEGIALTGSHHPSPETLPLDLLISAGELALARGETELAITLANEAIARRAASSLGSHPAPHLLKGQVLLAQREWDAAAKALDAALQAEEARPQRFLRWQILLRLSEAENQRGNHAIASELRQQARTLIGEIADQIGDPAARASFLAQPRVCGCIQNSSGGEE